MRSIVVQFTLWVGLFAIAPFALGQSEPKTGTAVNGGTTISYTEPTRIAVATEGRPSTGASDALVTIVEFSDFQCPFCATLSSTLKAIEKNYKDQVRIVFLQFPLPMHPNAEKAAQASLCANEQNQFWQMHDALFAEQARLGVDELRRKAAKLSLDMAAFNTCLDGNKYASAVRADIAEGVKAGVKGTPAFFVNGRYYSGSQPYDEIQRVIEEELQRTAKQ